MECISVAVTYDSGCTSDAGHPSSWYFQGHCVSKGCGMRGEGTFLEPNVEERRVLYEVPNKERISNVLDGFSESFRSVECGTGSFRVLPRRKYINRRSCAWGLTADNFRHFRCSPIRRSNRGNITWSLPRHPRHSPENCKAASVSHTYLITTRSSRPPTTWVSIFAGIAGDVADDGLAHRIGYEIQVR